ncbi:putative reverse transcriptase domain-containing protein [Tanacetum coccineum]
MPSVRVCEEDIPKTAFRMRPYLDKFVIVFIDGILIYSKSKEDHEVYLKLILELLEKEKLFGKISKCEFWLQEAIYRKFLEDFKASHSVDSEKSKVRVGYYERYPRFWLRSDAEDQVADALSRKEWMKPRQARALSMTIHSSIKAKILEAQSKASKDVNAPAEILKGLDKQLERKEDGELYLAEENLGASLWQFKNFDNEGSPCYKIFLEQVAIDFGGNWDTHLPLVEFSYNNSYHSSVKCAPFEALYGRKCRTPIASAEVGESKLFGSETAQETTDKIVQIKERLKVARDH